MGKGLTAFVASTFSPRTIVQKAANYTALLTDDQISGTTAITVTLPTLASMIGTVVGKKLYKLKAATAYAMTVTPGSGDTINKASSYTIPAGASIIIEGNNGGSDWVVKYPDTSQGIGGAMRQTLVVSTNGTTAVNVFSSAGAPADFVVESFETIALDATASNISLTNGTATVASVAKGTTANALVGEEALANTTVLKGNACTVVSSGTGNASVKIGIRLI